MEEEKEEILEAIVRLENELKEVSVEDLLKEEDLKNINVVEVLTEFALDGFIKIEQDKIFLLKKGKDLGEKTYKKHLFVEKLLSFLGMKEREAHNEACKLEHIIDEKKIKDIEEKLKNLSEFSKNNIFPLTGLKEGNTGIVRFVRGGSHIVRRLQDLGIVSDSLIKLKRVSPQGPVEVEVKSSFLVLGRGVASKIYVERIEHPYKDDLDDDR